MVKNSSILKGEELPILFRIVLEFIKRPLELSKMDRIGPEVFTTHWMLNYRTLMQLLSRKKLGAFGADSAIRPHSTLIETKKIFIGNNVVIRSGSIFNADPRENGGSITIGDDVLLGPGIHIYTNDHRFDNPDFPIIEQGYDEASEENDSVTIEEGAWIGANTTILKGVTIGRNSVVGAGAVVIENVPPYQVWAGVPAKKKRAIKS
ncbi:MAG: acyltransferase [Pseudomonadota bacterium]|nr:acyltransferase [Pseudomonadota bacterium]